MVDTEKPVEDNRPTESVTDVNQTNQEDVHPTELPEPIKNNVDPNEHISKDTITEVVSDGIGQDLIAGPIASTGYILNDSGDSKSADVEQASAMPEKENISQKPKSDEEVKKNDSIQLDLGIKTYDGVKVNDSPQLEVDTNSSEDVFMKKVIDKTSASPKDESKTDKKRKTSYK